MTKLWTNDDEYPFTGEPPLPEKVDQASSGDSTHQALANHSHSIDIGPFFGIPFALGWANFGGGFLNGEYARVGNFVVLRGLVAGPGAVSVIGTLPAGYRPVVGQEMFATVGNNAFARVDITTGGNIVLQVGAGAFVNLAHWFVAA